MTDQRSTTEGRLLVVVDDDEAARLSIGQMLRLRRFRVQLFGSARSALDWPELGAADCILSDIKMPGMDGEAFLAEVLTRRLVPPVVMITGHGDVAMAVRCLKAGAYDFLEKPFEDDVLLAAVGRAVEKAELRRESARLRERLADLQADALGGQGLLGDGPAMRDLRAQIEAVARSEAPVLIRGETGAGKELVARAIHRRSARAKGPLVAVNAGALPQTLLESELFGHARGAFTGAVSARDGKLVSASGGSLLLDEVESLSPAAQVQLLRVLEDGLVQPLGADRPREVDVRLLTTSKQDLASLVRSGQMREDFYHRIVVLTIQVPPLRERLEDIPTLLVHFLRQAAERDGVEPPRIPDQTLSAMVHHLWPGNVRELKNAAERMVATAREGVAGPFGVDEDAESGRLLSLPATPGRLRDELERVEREVIRSLLQENCGEVGQTAGALGISRRALYERMKKYGLTKEEFRG